MLPTARTRDRVTNPVPDRVDVAIIGAGPGGLMTGALLARAGRRVAILDGHYVAGGCATMFSRGRGADRYAFDIGLHYVGDCGPEGHLTALLGPAGVNVDWRPLDPDGFDELIFPDFRFRIPASVDLYRERLLALFPAERRGIDRYVRLLREVAVLGHRNAPKGWRLAWEALTKGRLAAAYKGATLGAFLDTCTKDPKLRAVIAGQNGDYGLGPGRVSAMLHAGLANHYFKGAYYPRGGGQVIADELAARVEEAGSSVHLRHAVTSILVEGGRAVGVRYQDPKGGAGELRAPVVVSNADLKRTWLELLPAEVVGAERREQARAWEMGGAIFLTCLAVRADLRALGMGPRNYWQFDDYDFDTLYQEGAGGSVPPVRGCYITSATQKDPGTPGHAPPGVETVEVMAMVPGAPEAWGVTAADAGSLRYRQQASYRAHKDRIEQDLVARLERLFPGSTREVLHLESATPLTHSRYTEASGGSGYGLAGVPSQFLSARPGYRGPVPGLYQCGGSTRSGHGILGALASGRHAARTVERDLAGG